MKNTESGEDDSEFAYPDDPFDPNLLVTNDAVAGEPIDQTGHYGGRQDPNPSRRHPSTTNINPPRMTGPQTSTNLRRVVNTPRVPSWRCG